MNPDLMRFDLLNAKPAAKEPQPAVLGRPVLRYDNPAFDALSWACELMAVDVIDTLDRVTAYDVTTDGWAFDLVISSTEDAYGVIIRGYSRWYATIDFEGKRCTRVEVVRRG